MMIPVSDCLVNELTTEPDPTHVKKLSEFVCSQLRLDKVPSFLVLRKVRKGVMTIYYICSPHYGWGTYVQMHTSGSEASLDSCQL